MGMENPDLNKLLEDVRRVKGAMRQDGRAARTE